jgi:cytidylate kinase
MFLLLASTLFVFGPSCGGKSTLSKALVQQLGPTWTYLDRDHLIQNGICIEDKADEMVEESILSFQSKNQNVVVDAQIPWRAQNKDEIYILVYAPLSELLARDSKRTARLRRSPERAHYARLYVETTFAEVFKAPVRLGFQYDLVLDSSHYSIENAIKLVLSQLSQMF